MPTQNLGKHMPLTWFWKKILLLNGRWGLILSCSSIMHIVCIIEEQNSKHDSTNFPKHLDSIDFKRMSLPVADDVM